MVKDAATGLPFCICPVPEPVDYGYGHEHEILLGRNARCENTFPWPSAHLFSERSETGLLPAGISAFNRLKEVYREVPDCGEILSRAGARV
jgi:hypothetical protein